MKSYVLITVLMFFYVAGFAQTPDETEVRKLNEAYDEAIKNADLSFYEQLLAEDYITYRPDGTTQNKSQVLEEIKKQKSNPSFRYTKLSSDDVKVKQSGNLAVVSAKWDSTTETLDENEPHDDTGHYLAVYEKKDGRWQLISEMGNEKPHSPEELEPSLKKASNNYDEAIKTRDSTSFKNLLADDYFSTNQDGKLNNREQDIARMFDPQLKLENISTEDKKFRIYRNFAVETGKYNVSGTYKGEEFQESGRYTSTWRYKDGKWQMVADHTSLLNLEELKE